MMVNRFFLLLMICLMFMLVMSKLEIPSDLWRVSHANDGIIRVPQDVETIQEAINMADNGFTILVEEGIYFDHIIVNKSVSLIGKDKRAILDARGISDCVVITADNVTLTGFTILNGGFNTGIKVDSACNNIIVDNVVMGNWIGIELRNASRNLVKDNNFTRNRYGIILSRFAERNLVFRNMVFFSSWNAIELNWANDNVICGNTFAHSRAYGLEIPVYAPSRRNIIFHNNFINNTIANAFEGGYPNYWNGTSEGNYWDDYDGVDEDEDGLGDVPYYVPSGAKWVEAEPGRDNHPLMGVFSSFSFSFEELLCTLDVISNISISDVRVEDASAFKRIVIKYDVDVSDYTMGFCRVTVPHAVLKGPYFVEVDGGDLLLQKMVESNVTHTILYLKHSCPASKIVITSEFPSIQFLYVLLLLLSIIAAIVIIKRLRAKICGLLFKIA